MNVMRFRIVLAALLLFAGGATAFTYFKYKQISEHLISQISGQAAKKLGRQVKFKSISFSLFKGIQIKDACVSRRPDFSKGNFFCAARAVVRPELYALVRNKVYFSRVAFDKPVLKVRERGGAWDFADLLALLPETSKGLYLTWNVKELTMKGAVLEADMETSGLSLALEDADITLKHYSAFGGNYGLAAAGTVKSAVKGKLLTSAVKLKTEANFDYGGLSSAKGSFSAADSAFGAITLENLKANWEFFNLRKTLAEKNYSVTVVAEKLVVPGQENSVKAGVSKGLALFSSAMGRSAPKIDDIEMASFGAAFRLDNSLLSVKDIALRTNFLNLDASLSIDGPAKTAEASLDADIGNNKLKMSASGPMGSPEIKPLLSATLSAKFKEALANLETGLLKIFPVTGE
ncbi:MAG: hypothetical protein A2X35_09670 [Elusimicrobia bacterium GWA2_61_42]|nr:MAG: hypothetical protein A2X35_09670 [Elusimicrobia bacterium GWA2_61_42]OGR78859.1 MAG: hypothetical protein A2X38_04515 [Elusimicrobia bacterium GWC2_61_25]